MQHSYNRLKHLLAGLYLMLLAVFLFSACAPFGGDGGNGSKSTGTKNTASTVSQSPTGAIQLGTQPCPDTVKDPASWNAHVSPAANQKVEHVSCGYLMGTPSLQAVVMVRHKDASSTGDIFVYNHITSTSPNSIFTLKGLLHGDAKISAYNTLLTAQEDPNSLFNKGQTTQWTVDLAREYKWSDQTGTFAQVVFSGIFPDTSRYQAEFEQDQVNTGRGFQQWRLDTVKTTQNFVQSLLKWPLDTPTSIVSGGGAQDIKAIMQAKNASSGSTASISLGRLERNANGGIWEVTDVKTNAMSLTTPQTTQPLTSPITVEGSGTAVGGTIGTVTILDHQYTDIGHSQVRGTNTAGQTSFKSQISYTPSFHAGAQEGIIALYAYSDNSIVGVVMVKELLGA